MKFLCKKVHIVLLLIAAMTLQVNASETPRRSRRTTRTTTRTRGARGTVRRAPRRARVARSPRAVMQQVKKTTSTFEQILDQSAMMINATGKEARSDRSAAKTEINNLMAQLKKENPKLHDHINNDVATILKTGRSTESKDDAKAAYDNLIKVREKLNSEAKQTQTIRKNIEKVKMAAPEEKQAVAAQAVAEIQAGNEAVEQAGIISRVTDFFLDKEVSTLTKLFYATVGATALAGAGYVGYQYVLPAAKGAAKTIYGMSWKDWKNLPAAAQERAKTAYEAATLENIAKGVKATPGAIWGAGAAGARKIYGAGEAIYEAGAGMVGSAYDYFREQTVEDIQKTLDLAKYTLKNAYKTWWNNPQDPVASKDYLQAKNNVANLEKALADAKKAAAQQSTQQPPTEVGGGEAPGTPGQMTTVEGETIIET